MTFDPDYGQTLLTDEEQAALTGSARALLGEPILKADLYDLEQQVQAVVADELMEQVLQGILGVDEMLTDHFVRDLHRRLYEAVWTWGGRQRSRETNIGVAPEQISVALRSALDDLRFRWDAGQIRNAQELGISVHAALVRIHPFVDGNGRTTRLLADLIFLAAQGDGDVFAYDWDFDRDAYIQLLRDYDRTLDARALIDFIPVVRFGDLQ